MHKVLWGCAAAAVAAVGVGCLTVDYACDHPDSWLGRCFVAAQRGVAAEAHTLAVTRHTAEIAFRGVPDLLGTAGPVPVCPESERCPAHEPAAVEDAFAMEPAVLPGGIVMHEEEGALPAKPLPPVRELIDGLPAPGGAEESEEAPMPRAEDDTAKMPRVEDDLCPPSHEHHGMPHTIKGREAPAGNEECEPALPKMRRDGGETPHHPDVDTMEVRPSDLWFFDFTVPF
jgi:hypothetical protein